MQKRLNSWKMDTENKLTPQRSLDLIQETLESNRRAIIAGSAKFFFLWGGVLALFSLAVWFFWNRSGNPVWNLLWLGMPLVGYPAAAALARGSRIPQNYVSSLLGRIWAAFAFFAFALSALAVAFPMNLTLQIIILLGLAETVSGIALKSWPIIIAGAVVGIGGACAASLLAAGPGQVFLFTGAAVVLALTGLAIKLQK